MNQSFRLNHYLIQGLKNLNDFKAKSDLIIANRLTPDLQNVRSKFIQEIFWE